MTPNANPMPWNRKRGKLSVFARGASEPEGFQNAHAASDKEQLKRAESQQAPSGSATALNTTSGPARAELANGSRIPLDLMKKKVQASSAGTSNVNPSSHQSMRNKKAQSMRPLARISEGSAALSPYKKQEVKTEQPDPQRDIFEGSQLGESFMRSGLTTPQNEPEDFALQDLEQSEEDDVEEAKEVKRSDYTYIPPTRMRKNAEGSLRLHIGENGLMTVNRPDGRVAASGINDGFQNTAADREYTEATAQRPASPARRPAKLPYREVKISRPRHIKENRAPKPPRPRSPSPRRDEEQWEGKRRRGRPNIAEVEEEEEEEEEGEAAAADMETVVLSLSAEEDVQTTPKPKKAAKRPQSTALEIKAPPSLALNNRSKNRKRSRGGPDYDDVALSSMTFSDLQNEPFDLDPAKAPKVQNAIGDADTLSTKLDRIRSDGEYEQREFFSNMSINDWEESGDWFVEQFAGIMNRLKDARREKRDIVAEFEAEAAKQEEAVRLRSENIDRKLTKMKKEGHRVVNDRAG